MLFRSKIGMLHPSSATAIARQFEAFTQGLRELGYFEGQNIAIEQRYAEGSVERLPALAAELANLHVDVFVVNSNRVAEAVQQTTTQIPIVMISAEEPVASGLAKSLARPGGTITGVAVMPGAEIYGKNLELLTEVLPKGTRIDLIAHYDNSSRNPHQTNNPPKLVSFGEQTTDEMCFAFLGVTYDRERVVNNQ